MAKIRSQQLNPNLTGSFNLSGSFIVTGSLHSTNSIADSGSLASRMSTVEGNIGAQDLNTYATPTFAGLNLTDDTSITGSLSVTGDVTARTFIVSSSVSHFTQSFSSGSTAFGDTSDDSHTFTGNITASGDISGSVTSTGSFGELQSTTATIPNLQGNVALSPTNVAPVSIGGDGRWITLDGTNYSGGSAYTVDGTTKAGHYWESNYLRHQGIANNTGHKFTVRDGSGNYLHHFFESDGNVEFVGNVSSSATSTGSFGTVQTTTGTIPTLFGNTTFSDNLTVGGNLDVADTIYHTGDSNTKIRFPEADTISFHTSGVERVRFDSSGNVGIGTANPTRALDVVGDIKATGDVIAENYIVSSSVVHLTQSFSSGSTIFGDSADDVHEFIGDTISGSATSTGSFGQSYIVDNSHVGGILTVGSTSTPDATYGDGSIELFGNGSTALVINDTRSSNRRHVVFADTGGMTISSDPSNTIGVGYFRVKVANGEVFRIAEGGNTGIGVTDPDVRNGLLQLGSSGGISIIASGNISGSAASTGSFGQLEIGNGGDIILTEDQRIYFEADKGTWIESSMSDSFRMVAGGSQMLLLDYDTGNRAVFGNGT